MSRKLTKTMRREIADKIAYRATVPMREEIKAKATAASARFNAEYIAPFVETMDKLPDYFVSKLPPSQSVQTHIKRQSNTSDSTWAEILVDSSGYHPPRYGVVISDELYDDFHAINQMHSQMRSKQDQLRSEIMGNLEGVFTTKRLIELWPETAEFVGEEADGAKVEIPLSAIIARHCGLALAAPASA